MMDAQTISVAGDPRGYAETDQIRDEMAKLTHPARPDVDWRRVEQCCQALFSKNGVDLRTAVFYAVARGHRAGLAGLHEGLSIIDVLVCGHWMQMWPQQTHTRMELLSWLTGSVLQRLRALTLSYADLPLIYRTEACVARLCNALELLELKQLSRLEQIQSWLQQAAATLEQTDASKGITQEAAPERAPCVVDTVSARGIVKKAPPVILPQTRKARAPTKKSMTDAGRAGDAAAPAPNRRAGFMAGFICALLLAAATGAAVWWLARPAPAQALFDNVALLPVVNGSADAQRFQKSLTPKALENAREDWLMALNKKLTFLAGLPALWRQTQGDALLSQADALWPDTPAVATLRARERQRRESLALPAAALENWNLAQQRLARLTERLNALDERRGRWLTGSELKTAVFDIRQALDKTPPLEELLRQLAVQQAQGESAVALRKQIDDRFEQLLNRYALLTEKAPAQPRDLSEQ
ncbi:VasL domain-containing protein [Tenebrionibacter intestinalis]|jgi:type VI secretion system protein VasL|uniref:Type VI secretion system ImpA family N-terminal domain-containing protein n=2 Tax=Tenebrionibacter/Tenebrionicola group TaxID=2969848 RepID=A0A8K0V4Z6_9ENTR|nr:VasL domain-containing protein [Tenebrionibacter intestinalis]MBK4714282.1 type VI secretion system ImpA family N-terminal domain-containing protein [Tenebrionibacter intestinalis]